MNELLAAIFALGKTASPIIVAIDGRCGSGKTTLAAKLAAQLDCNVIHMDDFFLRPSQRTPERLAAPGENVDHERFLQQVLLPLEAATPFTYRPFDFATMTLGAPLQIAPKAITLVEGSYSCHPKFWDHYHLRVFCDVAPEEQMQRIVKRDPLSVGMFQTKWIPLEERYFSAFSVQQRCDFIIKGSV